VKTAGGKIIRVEAHPIPEHPRPKRVQGRAGLVGDAAGYVTKCSGAPVHRWNSLLRRPIQL
jgi:geranylgeranyl diphosphate/geranylgeranyl-bacteriochlorophyllide a reductase